MLRGQPEQSRPDRSSDAADARRADRVAVPSARRRADRRRGVRRLSACEPTVGAAGVRDRRRCLLFRLGGLSKIGGLPQVKLGWMTSTARTALVAEALDRLELICDTYLSVSTPVQLAARALLDDGAPVRDADPRARPRATTRRCATRWSPVRGAVDAARPDGGWSAVLRVPATRRRRGARPRSARARRRRSCIPGFFFDFPREAYLVVSLLPEPSIFATRRADGCMERVDGA